MTAATIVLLKTHVSFIDFPCPSHPSLPRRVLYDTGLRGLRDQKPSSPWSVLLWAAPMNSW